ncbi:hypothetical protein [Devosia chinhatensis]|nr:hypothetical protein [Devosia chinhatensis]
MLQILATATGTVLAALGWALQRRMRGDAMDETIRRRLRLVELYQRMKSVGLDVRALDRLEGELTGPRSEQKRAETPENQTDTASVRVFR